MREHPKVRNLTREVLEPLWNRREISFARMGAALGVSAEVVRRKGIRLGLPPRGARKAPHGKCDAEAFRRLWLAGVKTEDMARHFGYAEASCVTRRARRLGLPKRQRGRSTGAVAGWAATISLTQYLEAEMARMIQGDAGDEGRAA